MLGLYKYINQINLQSSEVLQVWVNESDYEVLETVNPIFESMYNVEVQLKIIPSDKVITNLPLYKKSNEYPDIINVSHTLISDLVEMNAIHPMSDIFDSFNILPNVKSAFKVKGEYYGVLIMRRPIFCIIIRKCLNTAYNLFRSYLMRTYL